MTRASRLSRSDPRLANASSDGCSKKENRFAVRLCSSPAHYATRLARNIAEVRAAQSLRSHVVGAVLEPIPVAAFSLIMGQRNISGSPTGSPVAIETMLDFAARHNVAPQTEHFPMSKINEAFVRLESGKAHYRIVLDADF